MTTIATYNYLHEAQFAQSVLQAEGIDAFVPDENMGALYPPSMIGGIRLQVREEDALRAKELLQEIATE